jgi:dipeptidyl aminopeptidase/acylaminoacyl peptidase
MVSGFALLVLAAPAFSADAPAEKTIAPNDNLIVEGIPPVPASIADQAGRYAEFRAARLTSLHPLRREMLVSTRFADTWQIHRVAMPGGDRTQLTFFPDNVFGAEYEPTQGESFLFAKDQGGNEQFQVYRFDVATGSSTLLTDGKSRNTSPLYSNHGNRIAFGSTQRNGNDVDLWVMDPMAPGSAKMLTEWKGGGLGVQDWSPDDSKLLIGDEVSANESNLWIVDAKTGEKTQLTPPQGDEKVAYGGAAFSRDGKGVYLTSDQGSEFQRLTYMDLATKKITVLTPQIQHDVDNFALRWDGAMIAFVTNDEGTSGLHLLDTKTLKEVAAPKLPIGLVGAIQWHRNNHDLAFGMTTSRSTGDAYMADIRTGKVERWTQSETGGINTASFSMSEPIQWTSFDNKKITGFLFRPAAKFTGKRPVIIDIHGGPEGEYRPGFLGRSNYLLNELGVAIVYPNVRGSTGFGKSFVKLDNGFLREDSYKDISALFDWIAKQPELDADRVMVTGGSYGGFMTLAVATHYNDRIRCAVDVVGPSNLVTLLQNTSGYRRDLRRVEYGDERDPKMKEFLDRIAPANNAKNITKPLFVIQGTNDPRVPRTESAQMVETVRKNGTPVWYLEAKDEGHGFQKKKNVDFQFYSTVMFIRQYLIGEEGATAGRANKN